MGRAAVSGGDIVAEPTLRIVDPHGRITAEWPRGRGLTLCAPEIIDQIVTNHNDAIDKRMTILAALDLHAPECRRCGNVLNLTTPRCRCQELRDADPVPVCGVCVEDWSGEVTQAWPCETARALGAEPLTLGGGQ